MAALAREVAQSLDLARVRVAVGIGERQELRLTGEEALLQDEEGGRATRAAFELLAQLGGQDEEAGELARDRGERLAEVGEALPSGEPLGIGLARGVQAARAFRLQLAQRLFEVPESALELRIGDGAGLAHELRDARHLRAELRQVCCLGFQPRAERIEAGTFDISRRGEELRLVAEGARDASADDHAAFRFDLGAQTLDVPALETAVVGRGQLLVDQAAFGVDVLALALLKQAEDAALIVGQVDQILSEDPGHPLVTPLDRRFERGPRATGGRTCLCLELAERPLELRSDRQAVDFQGQPSVRGRLQEEVEGPARVDQRRPEQGVQGRDRSGPARIQQDVKVQDAMEGLAFVSAAAAGRHEEVGIGGEHAEALDRHRSPGDVGACGRRRCQTTGTRLDPKLSDQLGIQHHDTTCWVELDEPLCPGDQLHREPVEGPQGLADEGRRGAGLEQG